MPLIIGIDPGLDGGIAVLEHTTQEGLRAEQSLTLHPMPAQGTGAKGKREIDRQDLLTLLGEIIAPRKLTLPKAKAYLEKVHSMPKQGMASTWSFATSTESVRMALVALGIPYEEVLPQAWQRLVCGGAPKDDPKAAALAAAKRLWPGTSWLATPRSKKPHQGLVDAACIARYGWLREGAISS